MFFCSRDLDVEKTQVIINLDTFLPALNKQKLTPYSMQAATVTQEDTSYQKIYIHPNTF